MECRYVIYGFVYRDNNIIREVFGTFNDIKIAIGFMENMKEKYPLIHFRIKDLAEKIEPLSRKSDCTYGKDCFKALWNKVNEIIDHINEESD